MGNLIRAEWRRFKRDPFLWGIAAVGVAYGCYLARGTWGAELPREINSGDQTVPGAVWLLWQLPGDPTLPVWVCALLPVLTIAREFSSREVNLVLISGHRRGDYFLLKTLELPLLAALFCGLLPLIALGGRIGEIWILELLRSVPLPAAAAGQRDVRYRAAGRLPAAGCNPLHRVRYEPRHADAAPPQAGGHLLRLVAAAGLSPVAVPPRPLLPQRYGGHPLYRWDSRNSGLSPAGHGNRLLPFPAGRVKVGGIRESSPAL